MIHLTKTKTVYVLCLVFCLTLFAGCGKKEAPEEVSEQETARPEIVCDKNEELSVISQYVKTMPALYIETIKEGKDASDFATKPVTGFVSRAIASWTPSYVMPPEPYYEACKISVVEGGEYTLDHVDADVKVRGNWTTNYEKKPLRIRFTKKQNLLGLNSGNAYKNWVLLAEYKDFSMQRNRTALSLAREIVGSDGYFVSDAAFVTVFINDEYHGVYLLAEQHEVNPGRVGATKPAKDYDGTDIGYFMEYGLGFQYENVFAKRFQISFADNAGLTPYDGMGGSEKTLYALPRWQKDPVEDEGFLIKSDIYDSRQTAFIKNFTENAYRILYEAAYNDAAYVFTDDYASIEKSNRLTPKEAVEAAVDLDSLVDMYVLSELVCDADLYCGSFFLAADFGENGNGKLTFTCPWDFDSALGNKYRCEDGTGYYAGNAIPDVNAHLYKPTSFETVNPFLCVLANEDWFLALVEEKWTRGSDSGIFEKVYAQIDEESSTYSYEFSKNYEKWKGFHDMSNNIYMEVTQEAYACKDQKEASKHLLNWLKKRVEFLDSVYYNK